MIDIPIIFLLADDDYSILYKRKKYARNTRSWKNIFFDNELEIGCFCKQMNI